MRRVGRREVTTGGGSHAGCAARCAAGCEGVRGPDDELIADAIPHIAWTSSPDGAVTYVNRAGTDYTGEPAEAVFGWQWLDVIHPEDADRARWAWELATQNGANFTEEYRIRRFDGAFRWHTFRARPLRDSSGAVWRWIGTATDIEDQKQLELSLRRSEREAQETVTLLQSIEQATPVAFKLVDHEFRVLRMNNRLAQMNGHPVEDHLGRKVQEISPDVWPQVADSYSRALAGEVVGNLEVVAPDAGNTGEPGYYMASFYPVRIDQEIIGVGNVIVDITDLKRAQQTIARNLETVVVAMATTVEHRDPYTAGHQRRVAHLAVAIAAELGLEPRTIEGIKMAASIHDIGKISIPAEILSKPGPLSPAERALIREHAETGFRIVAGIEFPWPVAEMIRQHHERLDGSGYPRGLRQDEIDFGARVLAVADVVEAMTAHRPYRSGLGLSAALRQIREDQGRLLDTEVVGACCHVLRNGWSLSPEGRTALADPEFGSAGWRHG